MAKKRIYKNVSMPDAFRKDLYTSNLIEIYKKGALMNRLTKFSILILAILILANSVHAASFDAKVTAINDKIVVDETAQFQVTIQNYLPTDEDFTIKKAGYPFWDMYTEPLQNPITLKVAGNSSASITLFVHPLYITSVDTYTLDTGIVLQGTGEEQKVPVTIGKIGRAHV